MVTRFKKWFFWCLYGCVNAGPTFAGGSAVIGNGGQTVFCDLSNRHEGVLEYSLDYVAEAYGREKDVAPVHSVEESLARIGQLISADPQSIPHLPFLFRTFQADLYNTSDDSKYNYWEAVAGGPAVIDDQKLTKPLPSGCLKRNGRPQLYQAFRRVGARYTGHKTETTVYHFDPVIIERLKRRPLQLSFLLVHEWLWNVTGDVHLNRKINFFLHSKAFMRMTPREARTALIHLGLNFSRIGLLPQEIFLTKGYLRAGIGIGADRVSACLVPRQSYASSKRAAFPENCKPYVPNGMSFSRVATVDYEEIVFPAYGQVGCRIEWAFVCLAAR